MARKAPDIKGVRVFPPPPKGFDALAASKTDLARHGLPPRPDPRTQPGPAALWEKIARRYKDFVLASERGALGHRGYPRTCQNADPDFLFPAQTTLPSQVDAYAALLAGMAPHGTRRSSLAN
jgi:hypothetical protein